MFERNHGGANNWGEVKRLTGSGLFFGVSVAISDDTTLIGQLPRFGEFAGSAYVFERNEGGQNNWGEVKKLTASDAIFGDGRFGQSVALSGDTALVGAESSAYVFGRNDGGVNNWGRVKQLTAAGGAASYSFGRSVALSGDSAVVGAPFDDAAGNSSGSAYVFGPNDDFFAAGVLAGQSGSAGGANGEATGEIGEPDHAGSSIPLASVWWRWTPAVSGVALIDTCGSDFDTTLAVYTGSAVDALTEVASNDDGECAPQSGVQFDATAGTTYVVAVDGKGAATGAVTLRYDLPRPIVCPDSDIRPTVFIDGVDTGVPNPNTDTTVPTLFESTLGCTVADLIQETADLSAGRAQFLRNLQMVLRALVMDGTLTFSEALTLSTAAAESDLP